MWTERLSQAELLLSAFHAEREQVVRDTLVAHDWNLTHSAEALGKSVNTVRRWLCRYTDLRAEYDRNKRLCWVVPS